MTVFCCECEQKCKDSDKSCPRCGHRLGPPEVYGPTKTANEKAKPLQRKSIFNDPMFAERWWRRQAIDLSRKVSIGMMTIGLFVWIVSGFHEVLARSAALLGLFLFVLVNILNTLGRICDLLTFEKKSD